jgi:hypothetical protein
MTPMDRRRFLALSASGISAAIIAACSGRTEDVPIGAVAGLSVATPEVTPAPLISTPAPTPTPEPEPPVMPRGRESVTLMAGTEFEASGIIFHSGQPGPRLMVLGGVHGNEPGGWIAAERIATWEVERGMLIVLPRLNHRAAAAFQRTLDGYGDLNRLYPGDPDGPPMARMAAEIVALARQWRPHWLFDLHESWGFYNERGPNSGTAFIGQTVTTGGGPETQDMVTAVVEAVNRRITPREQLELRLRPGGVFGTQRRGTSSLSLGNAVPGLTPILVEMGQDSQPETRRSELHQLIVGEMVSRLGMA